MDGSLPDRALEAGEDASDRDSELRLPTSENSPGSRLDQSDEDGFERTSPQQQEILRQYLQETNTESDAYESTPSPELKPAAFIVDDTIDDEIEEKVADERVSDTEFVRVEGAATQKSTKKRARSGEEESDNSPVEEPATQWSSKKVDHHASRRKLQSGKKEQGERAWVVLPSKEYFNSPLARWCTIADDGEYQWDREKIKCVFTKKEWSNKELLPALLHGTMISSQIYSLIFDHATENDNERVWLRSIPFFNQLLDGPTGRLKYQALNSEQKQIVAVGVRDLFLAGWKKTLAQEELELLASLMKVVDAQDDARFSFYPQTNFSVLNFAAAVDGNSSTSSFETPYYAQITLSPPLFAVFVDPAESSYHNFENIIPLDRWILSKYAGQEENNSLVLSLTDLVQTGSTSEIFTCKIDDPNRTLSKISSLDLYVKPLNAATRGGERFIFSSATLSKSLTEAVRSSGILSTLGSGNLESSFQFVNFVFRCNRFAPGDAEFQPHLDTPYYDSSRNHVSKYTMLLYLSAGHNDPALAIDDVQLDAIEEMTCVVFDQRYKHEGRPFIDTTKVFMRTELIFQDDSLQRNKDIASLFSTACYMTGHTLVDESLSLYAHECFEKVNSLHWNIERELKEPTVHLLKTYQGIQFVTNGYDYWFPKCTGGEIGLKSNALLAVLDYVNIGINGAAFRSQCESTTLRRQFSSIHEVWKCFNKEDGATAITPRLPRPGEIKGLFKIDTGEPFERRSLGWSPDSEEELDEQLEEEPGEGCCCFHSWATFNAWEDEKVKELYENCCMFTRYKLLHTPLLVFGKELVMVESRIKVIGDKIYFLTDSELPSVNFAACQILEEGDAAMFVGVDCDIAAPKLVVPPVLFKESEEGYHFVLDMWRNDWVVSIDDEHRIPVPVVRQNVEDVTTPFLDRLSTKDQIDVCADPGWHDEAVDRYREFQAED